MARVSQFLDPEIYKAGKKVTIAGEVTGEETRALGNTEYAYPVVAVRQLHLWPLQTAYLYEPLDYWPWWMDVGETFYWGGDWRNYDWDRDHEERHGGEDRGGHDEGGRGGEGGDKR